MRSKSKDLMKKILDFINNEYFENGKSPTMQEIANNFGISKGCASNYIAEMKEKGMLDNDSSYRGIRTKIMNKVRQEIINIPVIGCIACGSPMLAEENIETYLPIPKEILGNGDYFILRACGESMINSGIDNGDLVIVRKQETANEGQIIVALLENETTLKRYFRDDERKQICLHPENNNMMDMYYENVDIQGIAIKVIKDIF